MPDTMFLLYETCPFHTRCALFDGNGRLVTLRISDASRPLIEGAVVWGRVRAVNPSLSTAFVDIGDTHDAVLPFASLPKNLRLVEGQPLLVRITRGGFGEKGARLDARVAHRPPQDVGECPRLFQPAPTALTRALQDAGPRPVTVLLPHGMAREEVARHVPERAITYLNDGKHTFDALAVLDEVLDILKTPAPTFDFPAGTLIVEMTSAVATIDVNFRGLRGAAGQLPGEQAILAANLAAAEDAARLIRLFDLGGSVIVDFITPPSKQHREMVTNHLQATMETTDDDFESVRPMSRHGLVELNRSRRGPSLNLLLATPAYVAGEIALRLWREPAGMNPHLAQQVVVAHPQVLSVLQHYLTTELCLTQLGRHIVFQPTELAPVTAFRITSAR
jgi:hypothetical protein